MPRAVWIGGLAVVAAALAMWVFRTPDTGPLPSAEPAPALPADAPSGPSPKAQALADAHPDARGPRPESLEREARLSQADAMLAGGQGAAWAVIKMELVRRDTPAAMELAEAAGDVIGVLRDARRAPDELDIAQLQAPQDDLRKAITDAGLADGPIGAQFHELDALRARYAPTDGQPAATPEDP